MKARHKRIAFVAFGIIGLLIAASLIVNALRSNIAYSFNPTQVQSGEVPSGQLFRLAGMVKEGSIQRSGTDLTVTFIVTDTVSDVTVSHTGILPDLFKEGQGTVTKGQLNEQGVFIADDVLAKHDESYMPPEAADAMAAAKAAQSVQE